MQKIINPALYVLVLVLSTNIVTSQEYKINNYGINEGISHPFVYTINQDNKGYIWIGTGEGLSRFNGFAFNNDLIGDSITSQVASVSFKDSRQNLWFGYNTGSIGFYDGKKFNNIISDIEINSSITGFGEISDGNIVAASLNNGLLLINYKTKNISKIDGLQGMFTSVFISDNFLLLGSQEGLSAYSLDNSGKIAKELFNIKELEFTKIQDIQPSSYKNNYWIATEDQGVFKLTVTEKNYKIEKLDPRFNLGDENAQSVFEDFDRQLWISSLRNGVYKLTGSYGNGNFKSIVRYNKDNGLPGNAVKKIFQDLEGNIWIATYGDGISLLTHQPMKFTDFEIEGLDNDITAISVVNNIYFLGGSEGLFRYENGIDKSPKRISKIPKVKITALQTNDNKIYIGTQSEGLFVLDAKTSEIRKVQYEAYSMGNWVTSIAINSKNIYAGTKDGIYKFNKNLTIEDHYTTTNGLPHNNIEYIFFDSKNNLLLATNANGIYELTSDGKVSNKYPTTAEVEFKSISEDEKGRIWAATYGDGVICFNNDSVFQLTIPSGLKANFCYSLQKSSGDNIWVGHRMGMSRINTQNMRISIYDAKDGITGDCNINSVFCDKNGVVYFGTTGGMITYDPSGEKTKKLPPFTNIVNLYISDKPYDYYGDITLPYKAYKLRIDFIGLSYSNPQAVRYQYKLKGYDIDWSDITSQTYASYPRIDDGEYTFLVRSYNEEGLSEEIPVSINIKIKPPIWKTWWFITLSFLVIVLAFYLILKFRERNQKKLQEYLERELLARTKEVVEQKEEIEIKNKDITDSINYAKRIQTSMLPPIKRLQHHFSGSFVFYSPRDIVSGDFYWFDQVNDNKFTIVCADSTGHGVPGAFMSMIGSTLIKDICSRESGNSPSRILQVLDCELRNTLNQNLDDGTKPGDGMDIIVCEIDLKTHYVRYASAMRPMIIYCNGEEIFIKGSRNSVGGHYEKDDNLFEDEGIQLSKGDIIYMFSDGYSDQFGGPLGKKFKMVRLKNLLQDIHSKPMDEQCLHVKNTFNLWKENYEQVDDVLFMGIKI